MDKESLVRRVYKDIDFSGRSFKNETIEDCQFIRCILNGVDFSHARIKNTEFISCEMEHYHDADSSEINNQKSIIKIILMAFISVLIGFPLVGIMYTYIMYFMFYYPILKPYYGEIGNYNIFIFGASSMPVFVILGVIYIFGIYIYKYYKTKFTGSSMIKNFRRNLDHLDSDSYKNNNKTTATNFHNTIFENVYFNDIYFFAPVFAYSKGLETCNFNNCINTFSINIKKTSLKNKEFINKEIFKKWLKGSVNFLDIPIDIENKKNFMGFNLTYALKNKEDFFKKSDINEYVFRNTYIKNIDFSFSNIRGVDFRDSYIENVNYSNSIVGISNCKENKIIALVDIFLISSVLIIYGGCLKSIEFDGFYTIFNIPGYLFYYGGFLLFIINILKFIYFFITSNDNWVEKYFTSTVAKDDRSDNTNITLSPITTKYSNSILINVNFFNATLAGTIFKTLSSDRINLSHSKNLSEAIFNNKSRFSKLILINILSNNSIENNLSEIDLRNIGIEGINFQEKNLVGANLSGSLIKSCNFFKSNLSFTNLTNSELINCNLTGACIRSWNIDSSTKFTNIKCDYLYIENNVRIPHSGNFKGDDFEKYIRKFITHLELFFSDGISWSAFVDAFTQLQEENDTKLKVSSIESKNEGAYLVRTIAESNNSFDREELSKYFLELYEENLNKLLDSKFKQANREIIDFIQELAMQEKKVIINGSVGVVGDNTQITTMNVSPEYNKKIEEKITEILTVLGGEGVLDNDITIALNDLGQSVKEGKDVGDRYNKVLSMIKSSSDTLISSSKAVSLISKLAGFF